MATKEAPMMQNPPTLTQFILDQQELHPEATGEFTDLMNAIGLAGKMISREVNRAGLVDILGMTGNRNVHGEDVQKLDEYANEVLIRMLEPTGLVCLMASEEHPDPIPVSDRYRQGKYVVLFDPLDGSSNIDVCAPIGTIFSVYRRTTQHGGGELEDLLQPGSAQVGAGYVIYGSSTMFVYSSGNGVHSFTLDSSLGEFLLTKKGLTMPGPARVYSANEGNSATWHEPDRRWVEYLKTPDKESGRPYSARYIGSLVADFHRNLLRGGIFAYPGDQKSPEGKLRLRYEICPLAYLAEQAGGAASDGERRILGIQPEDLHQRTPLYIGNREAVELVEEFHRGER